MEKSGPNELNDAFGGLDAAVVTRVNEWMEIESM